MAFVALTPQEQREYVSEHMDADMQFVVSEAGVSLDNQVAIARYYGSLRKFGALADDKNCLSSWFCYSSGYSGE